MSIMPSDLTRPMSAKELRQIRRRLRLSQAALGKQLGLTPGHVSRLERGEAAVTTTVAHLLRLLDRQGGRR